MPDVVTVDQIRDLIKSENIRPSDLFPMEKLVADPSVKGYAEDRVRERIGSEYQHRKSLEEELEKVRKEFAPKEAALQDRIHALSVTAAKAQVSSLLTKQKDARKLNERQAKFIESRLDKFAPSDPEKVETEFNAYLDSEVDEFGKITQILGIEDKKPDGGNGTGAARGTGGGTGPDETPAGGAVDNKYLDPARNPFIKLN